MRTVSSKGLTPKMRQVACLLSTGLSARRVSQESGLVCFQTISTWKKLPAFQNYLREQIDANASEVDDLLRSLRRTAVEKLADLMENENPQIVFKAAEALLDRQQTVSNAAGEFRQDAPINVQQIFWKLGM